MNIKKIIREEVGDFEWVSRHMDSVSDEPHIMALFDCYGIKVIRGVDMEPAWTHYGLTVYTNDVGNSYAVGSTEEYDKALYEYVNDLVLNNDWEYYAGRDLTEYVSMTEYSISEWADEWADSDVDYLTDLEIINQSSYSQEFEELEFDISDLKVNISDKEDEMVPFDEDSDEYVKIQMELNVMLEELYSLNSSRDKFIEDARTEVWETSYESYKSNITSDPVEFFLNTGLYSSVNELIDGNVVDFDINGFIRDTANIMDYGELGSYDGEWCETEVENINYICVRIQ